MKSLFIVVLSVLATSCSVRVASIKAPNSDLEKYNTFCWIQGCEVKYQGPDYGHSPERMQLLQNIIQKELESKGLVNDKNAPDLLVGFHVIVEEKEAVFERNPEMMNPYDRPITYWDEYGKFYSQEVHKFLKGSLIIDIIDSETGSVIWQTTAQRFMEINPQLSEHEMTKGVRKAFKEFPSKFDKPKE